MSVDIRGTTGITAPGFSGDGAGLTGTGKILQVTGNYDLGWSEISVPAYNNDRDYSLRQFGSITATLTTTSANSLILIQMNGIITNHAGGSHSYFDIKCNGNWISSYDGVYADHGMNNGESNPINTNFMYTPNVPAGTLLTFTFWGGDWGGGNMVFNAYATSNRNADTHGQCILMEVGA